MFYNRDKYLLNAINNYQNSKNRDGAVSSVMCSIWKLLHFILSLLTASDIHRDAQISKTVRLPHPNGVVVHRDAIINKNCIIMQQVTVGQLADGGAPIIDENVYIGSGAKILGGIRIGSNARIGANAVVLTDVPSNATVVGIPGRIVKVSSNV